MKIAGVVAEYNPFHNGHRYHLQQTRELGATHIVAVMGGNFLQRGAPALCEKHWRAKAALQGGADLVLELPLPYACATAERFAYGAVAVLNALGVVDELSFGSEYGKVEGLIAVAQALDTPQIEAELRRQLEKGITFAAARQQAVKLCCGTEAAGLLQSPNNILGIEYVRQLLRQKSSIRPVTVARAGAGHDSQSPEPQTGFASASWVRSQLDKGQWEQAADFLPQSTEQMLQEAQAAGEWADAALLERPLLGCLRAMSAEEIARLPDVSEGLEYRIAAAAKTAATIGELLGSVKTKRYTHARLRRILLCAWLGLDAGLCRMPPPYLRILGFNSRGAEVLSAAKGRATLPLSHSLAELQRTGQEASVFAALEAASTDRYHLITPKVLPCGLDYTLPVVKLL